MKSDHPSEDAYVHAAWLLMAEPRALRAIASVEAGPEGGFLPDGQPVILFERHLFHRLTRGKFDQVPDISNNKPGGYGPPGLHQHVRLETAAHLDRSAAIKSCSWGLYQILGLNHIQAGFPELQRFVNAMYRSADDHLRALVMFIRHDSDLVDAIRDKDWKRFARNYNGPNYAENRYDSKMAEAYDHLG